MYRPTIGLEIHAELATRTKMFCQCANDPDEDRPNINICPICLAHPGTLPVPNGAAVRHVLRVGMAAGGRLADFSEFDRKSYFYPDLPKGYQISQYEFPLVAGGTIAGVELTRIHLEEDTARSIHVNGASCVDFNRSGIPLMELVTEPVIHDAETAVRFARELQLLLRVLGAGQANLEKGEMRIEANISVAAEGAPLGTKVEVKNLNSYRSVERAISYEIERQSRAYGEGGTVLQETRGWDDARGVTFAQRLKEGSADYRYFPEPDLPKFLRSELTGMSDASLRSSMPELPWERRARYVKNCGLKEADSIFLSASPERGLFFDSVAAVLDQEMELCVLAANYAVSDLAGIFSRRGGEEYGAVDAGAFAKLIRMTHTGKLSSRGAKDLLALLVEQGGDPETLAQAHGLLQNADETLLGAIVDEVIGTETKAVDEYRAGKEAALHFLLGKAMRASRGSGKPETLRALLIKRLS